ncbi:MAG: alpha/beta hydrolase [Streptomyces sp.]|jgi:pimeloyl-ACP methyl ester carboxylesterase|nr:alpha/beta hydrolase [Streptomyces sp.]
MKRPAAPTGPIRIAPPLLTTLLAATVLAGCDLPGGPSPEKRADQRAEVPRKPVKPVNPPPGLSAALKGQRLAWSSCPAPSRAQGGGKAPGGGWECATMKAPRDYKKPAAATIDVALIRKRATGAAQDLAGSLLFNFGGPGVSGVSALPGFAPDYAGLGARYDLVSFDPRGVGDSAPVSCGDEEYGKKGTAACTRHSNGLRPYVGTANAARDMDLMRYLLGDRKLHYFGVSYGTELGSVYAHLFPRNVGRIVLDAVVDPTLDTLHTELRQAEAVQRAFDRWTAWCARTRPDDCPTGNDPSQANQRVVRLLDRLWDKPARTDDGKKLNGSLAAHGISNFLDRGKSGWKPLVKALAEVMGKGTGNRLLDNAYDIGSSAPGRSPADNEMAAGLAVECADSSQRLPYSKADEVIRRFKAVSPVFGETWSDGAFECTGWPVPGERTHPEVSAPGAAPVLVVGNTGDPTTPHTGAQNMARELGKGVGVLLTVPGEGHGSYPFYRCAVSKVDAYLLRGTLPKSGTICR